MSRYIDADAIDYDDYWWHRGYTAQECKQAERLINEQPTADVVEVVYCKDCKYFNYEEPCVGGTYESCDILVGQDGCGMNVEENFFCSYGERREDGEIH